MILRNLFGGWRPLNRFWSYGTNMPSPKSARFRRLPPNSVLSAFPLDVSRCQPILMRLVLDFEVTTVVGRAVIRSAWIVLAGEDSLRLTSCYVL